MQTDGAPDSMNASLLPCNRARCEYLRAILVIEPYGSDSRSESTK